MRGKDWLTVRTEWRGLIQRALYMSFGSCHGIGQEKRGEGGLLLGQGDGLYRGDVTAGVSCGNAWQCHCQCLLTVKAFKTFSHTAVALQSLSTVLYMRDCHAASCVKPRRPA